MINTIKEVAAYVGIGAVVGETASRIASKEKGIVDRVADAYRWLVEDEKTTKAAKKKAKKKAKKQAEKELDKLLDLMEKRALERASRPAKPAKQRVTA